LSGLEEYDLFGRVLGFQGWKRNLFLVATKQPSGARRKAKIALKGLDKSAAKPKNTAN
jgi:hypothetical protein